MSIVLRSCRGLCCVVCRKQRHERCSALAKLGQRVAVDDSKKGVGGFFQNGVQSAARCDDAVRAIGHHEVVFCRADNFANRDVGRRARKLDATISAAKALHETKASKVVDNLGQMIVRYAVVGGQFRDCIELLRLGREVHQNA